MESIGGDQERRLGGWMLGAGGCLLAKLASSGVLRADEPLVEASIEMAGDADVMKAG